MSTLSSSSSYSEIRAAYLDNASYEEDSSPAKARVFITACRMLLLLLSTSSQDHAGGARREFDVDQIRREQERAQNWLANNNTASGTLAAGGNVRHADLRGFRDP